MSDSMLLTSGRCAPSEGEHVQRGEDVALMLRRQTLAAWRTAMEGLELEVCVSGTADG